MASEYIQASMASILIVDDNAVNLAITAGLLKSFGISADTETSGLAALKMIQNKAYDIVFLDHMMPEIDGAALARRIRADGISGDALCIIALSTNDGEEYRKLYRDAGMQDFLRKPVNKQELNRLLLKWLPKHKIFSGGKLDRLRTVSGLDVEKALTYAKGGPSDYETCVQLLVRGAPKMAEALRAQSENPGNVAAIIRGVCTVLENAGAFTLAVEAYEIRRYALEGNAAQCTEKLSDFIGRFNTLHASVAEIMNE